MGVLDIIANELKRLGKSQKDLTDFLGLTNSSYTNWKSGKGNAYEKHLPRIAEFLDVSVDYLLGRTDDPEIKKSPAEAGGGYSDEVREVAAMIEALPPEQRKIVIDLAEALKRQQEGL